MRRVLVVFSGLCVLAIGQSVLAQDLKPGSHVIAVTVYADRATLTRQAEIDIPEGASTLAIENLPAGVFPDSLRVEGSAAAAVTLGAIDSKIVNTAELVEVRQRELQAKVQGLEDQRTLIEADAKANRARQDFLTSLGQTADDRANDDIVMQDLKPEQWTAGANALYAGMQAALRQDAERSVALRKLDEQIEAAKADMAGQEDQRSTYTVSVPVDAKAATKLTLRLSYQLPNATWRPVYDARLDTKTGKLALTQFGEVRQNTGEDWTDVALTLSTAQPTRGAELPRLSTQWLDLFDSIRPSTELSSVSQTLSADVYGGSVAGASMNRFSGDKVLEPSKAAKSAPMPAPAPVPAQFQTATIDTGGSVNEYRIPGKATVTADNSARKVLIGTVDSTGNVIERVSPALSTNAFLVAKTKIAGDAPLIPGNANLFRDGIYIGNVALPLVRPGDETTISFGIDDQVTVKRQILGDVRGTSGVIAKDATEERRVTSEIHNLHKTQVSLEVLETIPVGRNDDIKVAILPDQTTPGYTENAQNTTGLAAWHMDLAADAKTEVKLGWKVSWPDDKQITGLGR